MSDSDSLYPLVFQPVLKDYLWGGRNLATRLGRMLPPGIVAESWEIAAHEEGTTLVTNGRFAGQPLTAVHAALGLDLIGTRNAWAQTRGKFPLLVKILDAHDRLSVQVHPDDDYALANEGNELGKTEMWVVLHAEPDARIILGVRTGTTAANFREALAAGTLDERLHTVPIRTGDSVCVPSGTVHALLGGALIAEIQQNSNTTYRVYDWNRTQNGRARPLHIERALDVINFAQIEPSIGQLSRPSAHDGVRRQVLCQNRYFTTERIELGPGSTFDGTCDGTTLEIWGVIEGKVTVDGLVLDAVQFTLLPAALGPYRVAAAGRAVCLRCYVAAIAVHELTRHHEQMPTPRS